jgi:membrane protease subunit HflK
MRIDHVAYQRAARVASVGFLAQLGLGLTLLIFSLVGGDRTPQDTTLLYASLFILVGVIPWLALIVIFNQHKLERLEALEEDELVATRAGTASMFDRADEEIRVAARRLRLMYTWVMPGASLLTAIALLLVGWLMWHHLSKVPEAADFNRTPHTGWAVAICLAFSAISFIISRFVAGMAKQPAWQNLRGGAAYMVGNALVTLAAAVGLGFRFFEKEQVIEWIAYAIPILMAALALEIVLNFVLNLYRPRIAGEMPRLAFDSRFLSLFAAPDNIVRSINEAVNYQFGFDVTSSWGYQLLLRSFARLVILGVAVVVVLNTVTIVEPNEQAIRLMWGGRLIGQADRPETVIHDSGVMWKLPWPIQTAEKVDVARIRTLHLTARHVRDPRGGEGVQLWADDLSKEFDREPEPFIVHSPRLETASVTGGSLPPADSTSVVGDEEARAEIAKEVSLIDAEIAIQYRVKSDEGGMLEYVGFSSDEIPPRQRLTRREQALRALARREVMQLFSLYTIDEVLRLQRTALSDAMHERIQAAFDRAKTGVDVVAVDLLTLRPDGDAKVFEDLTRAVQVQRTDIANSEAKRSAGFAEVLGDETLTDEVLAALDEWERLEDEFGPDEEATIEQRQRVEHLLFRGGGAAAQIIADAQRDRWVSIMEAYTSTSRLRGQLASYRAAPEIYRWRETMRVIQENMKGVYKYIIGIDPDRIAFDVDITELSPFFNIGDTLKSDTGGEGQGNR